DIPFIGTNPTLFPHLGGSYIYNNWIHFNAGTLSISPNLRNWASIDVAGVIGNAPAKLVPWRRGTNQGLIINSGGALAGSVRIHELVGRDFGNAASYATHIITGAQPDITPGTDDWFVVPDRSHTANTIYAIGRSTGKCYQFTGGSSVLEMGTTGGGSV